MESGSAAMSRAAAYIGQGNAISALSRARPRMMMRAGLTFAGQLRPRARILLTSTDADAAPARLVQRSGATGFVAKTDLLGADLGRYLGPAG